MNSWSNKLKTIANSGDCVKESEILFNLPVDLQQDWDNFMRGKTCPILDNGDHGVYSWDLSQFLVKFNK